MKFLLTNILLLFLLPYSYIYAAAFTADAVQIRGESVTQAKMYWLDGNVRFEYVEGGVSMAQIFDHKKNKTIWLDNENKHYLEREIISTDKIIAVKGTNKKNSDPCNQFIDAECVFLKQTKMNGRTADKWLITVKTNGNDFHIFQWIDKKYKNVLRQENSDGTGLNVEIKDNQEINGRKVRKLTMTAFDSTGTKKQGAQWFDNELDIVIKQEYLENEVDELRNIKLGKVSKALFVTPKNYTLYKPATIVEKKLVEVTTLEVANKN